MDPTTETPIVCDMTSASDTVPERIAEYRRLFAKALIGREKTAEGIRFRFIAEPGIEAWVRELAAKEKACCGFYSFTVTAADNEVLWDAGVVDDDVARGLLAEFYALPDTIGFSDEDLLNRFTGRGLRVIGDQTAAR